MGEFWPVADALAYLAGGWRAERSVRDLATGDEGEFSGTTVFEPLEDGEPLRGLPQGVPRGLPQGVPRGLPQGAPQGLPQGTPQGLPQGAPQGLPQQAPQGLPQEAPQGLPQQAPQGLPQGAPRGLLHHESGTFVWRGVPRPAERTLRFLPGSAPGTADVRFADGRPFHDLDLSSGRHVADHPCSADLYRGEFTVRDADHWRSVWRVRGPAKDLVLTTDYARER